MNAKSVKTKVRAKVKLVKKHIRDHRELYIGVGVGIAASVIGFMMFSKSFQIAITNPAVINWKPVSNLVQMQMIRPGPKSFVVQCQETQKIWPSLREAAKDLNINPGELSKHLRNMADSIQGLHFEKLAEI